MGELKLIGKSSMVMNGDVVEEGKTITWRKNNIKEIALAREIFKKYVIKGWIAIGETSEKKEQIFRFNPNFEKIILSPLMVGG